MEIVPNSTKDRPINSYRLVPLKSLGSKECYAFDRALLMVHLNEMRQKPFRSHSI